MSTPTHKLGEALLAIPAQWFVLIATKKHQRGAIAWAKAARPAVVFGAARGSPPKATAQSTAAHTGSSGPSRRRGPEAYDAEYGRP